MYDLYCTYTILPHLSLLTIFSPCLFYSHDTLRYLLLLCLSLNTKCAIQRWMKEQKLYSSKSTLTFHFSIVARAEVDVVIKNNCFN